MALSMAQRSADHIAAQLGVGVTRRLRRRMTLASQPWLGRPPRAVQQRAGARARAGGDRPYLISGADDRLIKVWDYQTKACVTTLEVRRTEGLGSAV
jgi:hypothetical protein